MWWCSRQGRHTLAQVAVTNTPANLHSAWRDAVERATVCQTQISFTGMNVQVTLLTKLHYILLNNYAMSLIKICLIPFGVIYSHEQDLNRNRL